MKIISELRESVSRPATLKKKISSWQMNTMEALQAYTMMTMTMMTMMTSVTNCQSSSRSPQSRRGLRRGSVLCRLTPAPVIPRTRHTSSTDSTSTAPPQPARSSSTGAAGATTTTSRGGSTVWPSVETQARERARRRSSIPVTVSSLLNMAAAA